MKLTCMVIVTMLFLMACQLITADYSRERREYSDVRSSDKIQDSEDSKLTKRCTEEGEACEPEDHDCCSERCHETDHVCSPSVEVFELSRRKE
uniref:Conotoxin Di6.3 n=1 Tax=Conus distans TaxID=72281 RepID=M9PQG7_CONDI|nr:conotoxin Di6.3 [Conus distans]